MASNYKGLEIAEILYYLNCMRTLNAARATYKPKGRLKGQCVFINPKEDGTIPSHLKSDNIRAWSKYFENPIKVIDVRGNEHSIFDEDIDDTIGALNSILI
jgi:hypothetical protein